MFIKCATVYAISVATTEAATATATTTTTKPTTNQAIYISCTFCLTQYTYIVVHTCEYECGNMKNAGNPHIFLLGRRVVGVDSLCQFNLVNKNFQFLN